MKENIKAINNKYKYNEGRNIKYINVISIK